jgi:uncharacterized membrane protein
MKAESRTWYFVRKSLLGGLAILLPISIIVFFFRWIYQTVADLIAPLTSVFIDAFGLPKFFADWLAVLAILVLCFLVGTVVATRLGNWLWENWDAQVMSRLPGYKTVKEVIAQLMGNGESSMSRGEVARVWLFGRDNGVSVTALVTSRHEDGVVTVFVPTGPNPTSGFIYHVPEALVETFPNIGVESMMKTVVSCGAGTATLFKAP